MVYNLPGVDNDPEYTQGQRNHSSGLVLWKDLRCPPDLPAYWRRL